jgi:hypothetical protein
MTTPALAPATPVSPAYDRVAEVLPAPRLRVGEPRADGGWVLGSELAAGGAALDELLAGEDARIRDAYGVSARPDVTASFALHRYAWPAGVLFTLPYFLLRRVPRIAPEDAAFHPEEGWLTVRVTEFSCLPDDPAVDHPGARVVADEEALRAAVREAAADHLGPLLAAFGPRMRRGPRALWGTATDELTEGLWYLGQLLGEEERARAEASALLPGGTAPYSGSAAFRPGCGPDGEAETTRDRASCCLYYTLRPEDVCGTCPRIRDAGRRPASAG